MEWTAESFIDRVLKRPRTRWWAEHESESSLETALEEDLHEEISHFVAGPTQLFFFSSDRGSTIGRAERLGVELKHTGLKFGHVIDGAIHRGIAWVLGNAQRVDSPEAISLHVVKATAAPMAPYISDAVAPVVASLAEQRMHIVFVDSKSGEYWGTREARDNVRMPEWLTTKSQPALWRLSTTKQDTVRQLGALNLTEGRDLPLFGTTYKYLEFVAPGGAKLARLEWHPNHWQIIDIGLLLRGAGYAAVKIVYTGPPFRRGGRGVEDRIHAEMRERFGVLLEWPEKSS